MIRKTLLALLAFTTIAHAAVPPIVIAALPLTITVPGTYVLKGNLGGGVIDIISDSVILDLKGFTIDTLGQPIVIENANDVVRNGTVISEGRGSGVVINATAKAASITNVTVVTALGAMAINDSGVGTAVRGCVLSAKSGYGISCAGTDEFVTRCDFSGCAVSMQYRTPNITGDTFTNNTWTAPAGPPLQSLPPLH